MSQVAFAAALGTQQTTVSKWERGAHKPTPDMFAKIAGLAEGVEKFFYLEQAGIPKEYFYGTLDKVMAKEMVDAAGRIVSQTFAPAGGDGNDALLIPLLSDAIGAGNPRNINDKDVRETIPMLRDWLPKGGHYFAVRVEGASMEPVLGDGYIAFIDISKQDPVSLVGHIVAVRVGDGSTIKYLRKSRKRYMLVPENTDPRFGVQVLEPEDDWAVIGEVVKWIGEPPPVRK